MFRTTKPYYITMGIAVGIMILVLIFCGISGSSGSKELSLQEAQIRQLENDIASQSAAISSGNASAVSSSTGIDLQRVDSDNQVAKAMIQVMTNWTSYEEYTNARLDLIDKYGLSSQGSVMRTFFPEYVINDRNYDGDAYNFIDYYKLSCSYHGMKAMVRGISGDVYSYFTIVSCTGNKNGNGSNFNIALLYDVAPNGDISNVEAYTLDGYSWVE